MEYSKNPKAAYGVAILEAAKRYKDVVVLTCDLMHSFLTVKFSEMYPERFFNLGVAEQNMAGIAAGLATCGKIPFINTFSCFASMRSLEMLRTDIAYPRLNVKVFCVNSGISFGAGGTTHHSTEDLAIIRSIANFTLIVPGDGPEIFKAVLASIEYPGPVYIRVGRDDMKDIYEKEEDFQIGKANKVREGNDVTIIACGTMVPLSIEAAEKLSLEGRSARVLNMHTLKPLDKDALLSAAKETKGIVTAEEHTVIGGLGGAVAEFLSETHPTPIRMVGIQDTFCMIGPTSDLMAHHGLTSEAIYRNAKEIASSD